MYIYIENNNFISLKDIILIIDYKDFLKDKKNKDYLEKSNKKVINLSKKEKRTIIITNEYIYISSYTNRALKMRAEEMEKMKNYKS